MTFLKKLLAQAAVVTYLSIAWRAALGFLINVILARVLGPEDFGLYFFFLSTVIIVHAIIGEAMDSAMVRYLSDYSQNQKHLTGGVIGSALALRLILSLPILILGCFYTDNIAINLFQDAAYGLPLKLALVTAFLLAFFNFGLAILQAKEAFVARAVLAPLVNTLRLPVILVMIFAGVLLLDHIYWLHVIASAIGLAIILWVVRSDFSGMRFDTATCKLIGNLSKWNMLIFGSYLVYTNMAVPVLNYISGSESAGFYAAAAALTLVVEQAIAAILITALPRISKLQEHDAILNSVKTALPKYIFFAACLVPVVFLSAFLIHTIYGADYDRSVDVFKIVYLSSLLNIVSQPLGLIFFSTNRSGLLAFCAVSSMFVWFGAAWFLVPAFAELGAAYATMLARVAMFVLILFFTWKVFFADARITARSGV